MLRGKEQLACRKREKVVKPLSSHFATSFFVPTFSFTPPNSSNSFALVQFPLLTPHLSLSLIHTPPHPPKYPPPPILYLLPRPRPVHRGGAPRDPLPRVNVHVHELARARLRGHLLPARRELPPLRGRAAGALGHSLAGVHVEIRESPGARLRRHLWSACRGIHIHV